MDAPDAKIASPAGLPVRRLAIRLAGLLAAACLIAPASVVAAPVQARSAAGFVDSIGVATHMSYSDTVYVSRFSEIKEKLAELGVHHIREDLLPERPDQYQRLNELAALGIGSTLIMGNPSNGSSGLKALVSTVKNELRKVDAVEGPNEWALTGNANWAEEDAEYQKQLYTAIKSDPSLASLPVLGPSTLFFEKGELGDVSQWLDYGNVHPYPGGYTPEATLGRHLEYAAISSGSKPVVATETGYHNALNTTSSHHPASEAAMATYIPRIFFEYFRRGVARTFTYELVDHFANPRLDDPEASFGLLHNDLSPKPAFAALRNTIEILKDSDSSFAPGSLDYTLGGNQENLRQVLLQKGDGVFYLAFWRTSSVWDPIAEATLNPGSFPLSIGFNQPISSVEMYSPNRSSAAQTSISNPSGPLSLEVGPEVRILRIAIGEGSSAATTEPTPAPSEEPAPAPEGESTKKGGSSGNGKGRKRLALWASSRSVRAGHALAVSGRIIAATPVVSTPVAIQRWRHGWHTVDRGLASSGGFFRERVRLTGSGGRIARIRVVAPAAIPSQPIGVRVTG